MPLRRGVLDTTLLYIVCQWLATGRWFSWVTPVSSTNNTDRQDITEILLKVALISIKQPVFFREMALDTIWSKSRNSVYTLTHNLETILISNHSEMWYVIIFCDLFHICEFIFISWKGVSFYFFNSNIQISSEQETIWTTVDNTFRFLWHHFRQLVLTMLYCSDTTYCMVLVFKYPLETLRIYKDEIFIIIST